jgi:hypothetical protein
MRPESLKVPAGEEETITLANRDVTRLKQQLSFLVNPLKVKHLDLRFFKA